MTKAILPQTWFLTWCTIFDEESWSDGRLTGRSSRRAESGDVGVDKQEWNDERTERRRLHAEAKAAIGYSLPFSLPHTVLEGEAARCSRAQPTDPRPLMKGGST